MGNLNSMILHKTFLIIFFSNCIFILNISPIEGLLLSWFTFLIVLVSKIYSHIGFILLILEVRSCILIVLIFKSLIDFRFFFFFLCLIVGEARLGLSLIVFRSRIYRKELKILTLL